jgi:hypothetical protein
MMNARWGSVISGWLLISGVGWAVTAQACDVTFTQSLERTARLVAALRPDKPGQVRVFAPDGSEHTAGEARWMAGELVRAGRACRQGDDAEAARHLDAVRSALQTR